MSMSYTPLGQKDAKMKCAEDKMSSQYEFQGDREC